ncbi:hypothetical protein Emag_007796 [Eimeria magna]
MQSPPHTRSRTEEEDVVEVEPPHSVASQQTVQQQSPAAALLAAAPSTPVARKRQRTESAEPRIVKPVVRRFRPSDLKDINNAEERLAKPQTEEALQHKEIIYLHRRLKAYNGARKKVWKVARGFLGLPVEKGWTQQPESLVAKKKGQFEDSPAVEEIWDEWRSPFRNWKGSGTTSSWTISPKLQQLCAMQALGGLIAPRARHEEEDSDEVVESLPALPTAASSRVSAKLEERAELTALPATRVSGSARAAPQPAPTSPAAPSPVESIGQDPLPPLSLTTASAVDALIGFWMSSAERLATLMGPAIAPLREFFNGVYRTGQALLGLAVCTSVCSRLVTAPAAPREPSAFAPPPGPDSPSALPGTPEKTTPPPRLPTYAEKSSACQNQLWPCAAHRSSWA